MIRKEGPCGCITQVGGDEALGATTTTPAKCPCVSCGEGCRCVETKGRCDCAERIETANKEHRLTTASVTAPVGCVVELGEEDVCGTCGRAGCRCIALKGSCQCPAVAK